MSLYVSFEKCVTKLFEYIKMDMSSFDVTWAHVILFYAKCGVILSENDFLGRERSDYLNEIINEILNPMDIQDYVSTV